MVLEKMDKAFFGLLFILLTLSLGCSQAQEDKGVNGPLMTFEQDEYDFGVVRGDTVISHVFAFTNTGKDTLYIAKVGAS